MRREASCPHTYASIEPNSRCPDCGRIKVIMATTEVCPRPSCRARRVRYEGYAKLRSWYKCLECAHVWSR